MQTLLLNPNTFIGRSQEIAEIGRLLDEPSCRLLSLIGQGGIGKTRLALEIASLKEESFPDGIFFVELAPLSHASDILMTIAAATPFCFQADERDAPQQFLDYLREKESKKFLLILDNFEHLLDGADIILEILAVTRQLKILVTSREVLNLQEEWVRHISGLSYPDSESTNRLEDYGAIQLFLERARMIRGDLDLNAHRQSIIEICRLVEGMPLAIELAVGWLKTLQPAEIAQEIQSNIDILASRSRNLAERHRSIRSIFSQSWQQLSDNEREVFMKLSLFRGGFTRDAAESIAGANLHILTNLLDKSLIRLGADGRYYIHELLRQYGAEHLDTSRQTQNIEAVYAKHYLNLLAVLENDIKSSQQVSALNKIAADYENLRRAWQLALEQKHYAALNGATESLHFYADMRGRYHDIVNLFRRTIPQFPAEFQHEKAHVQARLIRLVLLGNMRIDFELKPLLENCLALTKTEAERGFCLLVLGIVAIWETDSDKPYLNQKAGSIFREAYEIYERLNDKFYMAEVLAWLAATTPDNALIAGPDYLMQSLELRREIGDSNGIGWISLNLAEVMLLNNNYAECERYSRESLILLRELGSSKGIIQAMFKLAQSLILKGDLEEARKLSEEMLELAHESNNLDGIMLSTGLLAFLIAVLDEAYTESLVLAQQNYELSQETFFGGHKDIITHWGQTLSLGALGHYEKARQNYAKLFWDKNDDAAPAVLCFVLEALRLHAEAEYEKALSFLSLAYHQSAWTNGWLNHWPLLQRLCASLRDELGDERYQEIWEHGSDLSLEASIQAILSPQYKAVLVSKEMPDALSERELEVLHLLAEGFSNRDIAERLVLSVGTVKVHTRNIYSKLNVGSRTQAIVQAEKLKIL